MPIDIHTQNKKLVAQLRDALYNYTADGVQSALEQTFHHQAKVFLSYPFESLDGCHGLYEKAFRPLAKAIPDLERRDTIVMAGTTDKNDHWVGCCGYYTGTFVYPWLDILPSGHHVAMRFHEFYRIENAKIVEMQALWDIPEVMMQANVWPMTPSLGREWQVPGPAPQNGLVPSPKDTQRSDTSFKIVMDMVIDLGRYGTGGVEAMCLPDHWHPRFSWYGPAGIGSSRGITGFRNRHQIPFLKAMPNRTNLLDNGYFFSDGDFVAFTAWPGMRAKVTEDGWLPVRQWSQPGDLLITVSSSGGSENILRAATSARELGCRVITLTGFKPDNPSRKLGDLNFYVDSSEYGFVETAHAALTHFLTDQARLIIHNSGHEHEEDH